MQNSVRAYCFALLSDAACLNDKKTVSDLSSTFSNYVGSIYKPRLVFCIRVKV